MSNMTRMLHANGKDGSTYKCGEKVPENQKQITDAQAMTLALCSLCFPNGKPNNLIKKDNGGGWI